MLIGYARVSTHEQSLNLQQDALAKAGCERTFTDVASGALDERQGLSAALDYLREGDTLLFREGRCKGVGRIVQLLAPHAPA